MAKALPVDPTIPEFKATNAVGRLAPYRPTAKWEVQEDEEYEGGRVKRCVRPAGGPIRVEVEVFIPHDHAESFTEAGFDSAKSVADFLFGRDPATGAFLTDDKGKSTGFYSPNWSRLLPQAARKAATEGKRLLQERRIAQIVAEQNRLAGELSELQSQSAD